jgi:cytoskeletal protein CcmA (bactofilin family)
MKKVLVLLVLFSLISPSFASLFKAENNLIVASSDNVTGNAYLAGNTVVINGLINGDLFVGGNTININGVVLGDVMAGANSVIINGNVTGDVRAAGSIVTIKGIVGGEVLTGAGMLELNSGSSVGEVNAGASNVILAGIVNGNVSINAENITVEKTSAINGFLNYTSSNDAIITNSSVITGFVQKNLPSESNRFSTEKQMTIPIMGIGFFGWLLSLASTLLSGYVLVRISKRLIENVKKSMSEDVVNKLLKGLGFIVLIPILCIIGLISMIASPLSMISIALYAIVLYVAGVLSAFFVGSKVLEFLKTSKQSLMIELLTGVIILELLDYVPVLGGIIKFLILLVSVSALINTLSERISEVKKKKIF